jgi:hypothetical protein
MTLRNIKLVSPAQRLILSKMHFGGKAEYDMFDFPGVSPSVFDELSDRYEAIIGNHRDGWRLTRSGANFAAMRDGGAVAEPRNGA